MIILGSGFGSASGFGSGSGFASASNLVRDRWRREQRDRKLQARLEESTPVSTPACDPWLRDLVERLPEGPAYYPADTVTDQPLEDRLAEIVREKALAVTRQEVPHSIAVVVEELEDSDTLTKIHASLIVERDSQKGIVIGKKGAVLKAVGTAVRAQLPDGAYLELFVKVDKDWQRRPKALERLGY
jgi:GTP-binding protein Era